MLEARKAYEMFKVENSRDLTEEEKAFVPQNQTMFIGVEQTETRVLELKKEDLDKMKRLEQNMKDTHSAFIKGFQELSR